MKQSISPMLKRVWKNSKRKPTAICTINIDGKRKQITLGEWGSKEAIEAYARLTAGITLDDSNAVTIATLCARFYADAERRAADPSDKFDARELKHYATVIKYLVRLYGDMLANRFTASCYRAYRARLVEIAPAVEQEQAGCYRDSKSNRAAGIVGQPIYKTVKRAWSANYVKQLMRYLRLLFSWGVGHDLVEPAVCERFKHVERLRCSLANKQPRTDIADDYVRATLPYMTPTLRDMVIIQRQNALRPNEVCNLRVGDIDRTGQVWSVKKLTKTYVPMIIIFCESDRAIIERHIAGKADSDYIFSPRESMQETWAAQAARRKSKVTPSQAERAARAAANKLSGYNAGYTVDAYRRAIYNAIKRANKAGCDIPMWTPYQLRHTAVTEASYAYGIQAASALAGHTNTNTTAIYEHNMERIKTDLAKNRPAYYTPEVKID